MRIGASRVGACVFRERQRPKKNIHRGTWCKRGPRKLRMCGEKKENAVTQESSSAFHSKIQLQVNGEKLFASNAIFMFNASENTSHMRAKILHHFLKCVQLVSLPPKDAASGEWRGKVCKRRTFMFTASEKISRASDDSASRRQARAARRPSTQKYSFR